MLKRTLLFLLTNLAIITVTSVMLSIFNVKPYLSQHGLNYQTLLAYAVIVGFSGSFISLFLSKWMAIKAFGIKLINKPQNETETWLLIEVAALAKKNNITMPEVGIYETLEPNAFATGWSKNNALVAISSGLINVMDREGVEGVLGHEISHIANGDMVTLTLLQGVVNTFVIFLARVAAFSISLLLKRTAKDSPGKEGAYYILTFLFEILFGVLATLIVMWFSRHREFRADAGSARHVGKEKMISALSQLKKLSSKKIHDNRGPSFNTLKISQEGGWGALFASHPPIEKRIQALKDNRGY